MKVKKARKIQPKRRDQELITCIQEYDDHLCNNCPELGSDKVSHPGGESHQSVDSYYCHKGFWKEDF